MKFVNIILLAGVLISFVSTAPAYIKGQCGPGYGSCSPGYCCSKFGWCGNTNYYCGAGCQSEFGRCDENQPSVPNVNDIHAPSNNKGMVNIINSPPSTPEVINEDRKSRCGPGVGSCSPGDCCSEYGWCGITTGHCGAGCQYEFGRCDGNQSDVPDVNDIRVPSNNKGMVNNLNEQKEQSNSKPQSSGNDEQKIWNFLMEKIGNKYGAAGLMGNLYAESFLRPDNLEDIYNNQLGMTDREYTEGVNNDSYKNFVNDNTGYGLAQWTYSTRKQALLDYAKNKGVSIDDLDMQLNFLWEELNNNYNPLVVKLKNATSVRDASNDVIFDFERPVDQGQTQQDNRAAYGEQFYKKFA
ncbi:carbohydrate-binding module family 18 protein [Piromyces sp. E2]|nr:carbohydrate-binding module family 18 protein [Piromyces sp. E2]|eukprot:OUM65878.1 carbohydrate-binding module family 18 protein [Piromyces sp. E2]